MLCLLSLTWAPAGDLPSSDLRSLPCVHSEVHPRGVPALQEALPGRRPAVGRRSPAVAQLQRQRRLGLAQARRLLQRQEGDQPEDVLHQQEPHHAWSGEQVWGWAVWGEIPESVVSLGVAGSVITSCVSPVCLECLFCDRLGVGQENHNVFTHLSVTKLSH